MRIFQISIYRKISIQNVFLVVFLTASLISLVYAITLLLNVKTSPFSHTYISYQIGATIAATLFFTVSLFLKNIIKTYIVIVTTAVVTTFYVSEIYLQFTTPGGAYYNLSTQNQNYPVKTNLELLFTERDKGKDAWLSGSAIRWVNYSPDNLKNDFIPFGGISNVLTIGCMEGAHTLIYQSDRHGFNNPPQVWNFENIDVLAIGDSFTFGSCVPTELNMIDRIRQVHERTINLGSGGNGTLLNLATLREYGPSLKPKIVLWFFFQNDLDSWESSIPLSIRYLNEPHFQQNLIYRQEEIDEKWKLYFNNIIRDKNYIRGNLYTGNQIASVIKLTELRKRLGLTDHIGWFQSRLKVTRDALIRADILTKSWGGKLIFIYLPDNYALLPNNSQILREAHREHHGIMKMVSEIRVKAVDLTNVFENHPNPQILFSDPRIRSHYSPSGYSLVSKTLLPTLSEYLSVRLAPLVQPSTQK